MDAVHGHGELPSPPSALSRRSMSVAMASATNRPAAISASCARPMTMTCFGATRHLPGAQGEPRIS